MAKNLTKYTSDDWVPVLLPKDAVQGLLKETLEAERKNKSYLAKLKDLQKVFKKARLFKGMTEEQIMKKLHDTREQLLKENPHAYIDYNS